MRLRREESDYPINENDYWDEGEDTLSHKKQVRKRLEEKLESRRLKREIDDYEEEYDYWDDLDKP